MVDSSQSQGTTVKQDRLFNFEILDEKFKQLRNSRAPSQGISTRLDSRAMDVPAHKHDRTSPNNELEKHPS
jgi:hypothetical protein